MEKAKTRKIKKWDEVHGEHEVEVSDNTGAVSYTHLDVYKRQEYERYAVPGEYLTDQQFSNMHREAEKYLGYPYVWGGDVYKRQGQ